MMRWRWLILVLMCWAGLPRGTEAGLISRVTTWTDGQVLTHSALNGEFDEVFDEFNGNISAANLAADSVGSSELVETDDYTMQNLTLSTTAPDLRWTPTGGDTFHFGAEVTGGSLLFLSNATDSVHYLHIQNNHAVNIGHTGAGESSSVPYVSIKTDGTGDDEIILPANSIGAGELSSGVTPLSNIVSFTRTAAAGSGSQAVTGMGFRPIGLWIFCQHDSNTQQASWGLVDDDSDEAALVRNGATNVMTLQSQAILIDDGSDQMQFLVTSLDLSLIHI